MSWILLFVFGLAFAQEPSPQICIQKNQQLAQQKQLWKSSAWNSLLHMFEGYITPRSEVDGETFFIATNGESSPEAELLVTIESLCRNEERKTEAVKIPKLQTRCLYPAREQFLEKSELGGWPKPNCPELEEWKARVGSEAVHLVFSSYYANNPSSVFGHTLLRFDRIQASTGMMMAPLLSYGVNYAAVPTTTNGALYAILGMTGGFRGAFASLPYYYKVREYSDFDSRDLWEYQLDLTREQIQLMLNHIWEVGFTHFNYYYFTENCSYHLLSIVDLVMPEANLHQKIPWWVIPVDSVKAIVRAEGLIKDIRFRPSLYNQLLARLDRLEQHDLRDEFFESISNKQKLPPNLNGMQQALVMDAILDYWDFKHTDDLLEPKSEASLHKTELLRTRAQLPMTEPLKFDLKDQERPDISHESARIGLRHSNQNELGPSLGVDMRFSLHDMLDPQQGYPRNATIEFFRIRGEYLTRESELLLTEFKFFEIQLLAPLGPFSKNFSWHALIGLDRSNLDCQNCLVGHVLVEGGFSLGFWRDRIVTFALAGGDLRLGRDHARFALASPLGTVGVKATLPFDFHTMVQSSYYFGTVNAISDSIQLKGELRKNFGLKYSVGISHVRDWQEHRDISTTSATIYRFF